MESKLLNQKASLVGHSKHRAWWISDLCLFFPQHCQRSVLHTHPKWKYYIHLGTCHGKDLTLSMKGHLSL